jgi:hypothetical protein
MLSNLAKNFAQFSKIKHIGRNPRFDREQHWAEIGNIGQILRTLSRYKGH